MYLDEVHEMRECGEREGKNLLKSHGGNYVRIHECMKRARKKNNSSNAKNINVQATQIYLIKYLRNFWKNLDWIGTKCTKEITEEKKCRNKIENNNKISGKLCVPAYKTSMNESVYVSQIKRSNHSPSSRAIASHK